MSKTNSTPNFLSELKDEIQEVWQSVQNGWEATGANVRNQLRHIKQSKLDYVVMPIGGELPERSSPPRSFIERQLRLPLPPLSLQTLNWRLRAIADADNVKGVLFIFRGFGAGMATLQNFRRSVARLREAGKECIVYTPYLDLPHYYAATAANRIIVPPGAQFDVLGIRSEVTFLKDALQQVGVQMDVVQISPYKSAFDNMGRSDMSPEHREQTEWLLEDQFDLFTAAMANGRSISQSKLQTIIDQAPHFTEAALELGLIDDIAYEDELEELLAVVSGQLSVASEQLSVDSEQSSVNSEQLSVGSEQSSVNSEQLSVGSEQSSVNSERVVPENEQKADNAQSPISNPQPEAEKPPKVILKPWGEAYPMLLEKPRRLSRKYVGVISLEGMIMMGPSRRPPIDVPIPFMGGETAGEQTLVRLLRRAEKLDDMAALILHVDSGGGSALASDLIGREVQRISKKKPVLAYIGNVAASGGYYVLAAAQHVMCQETSITGSIGVITARPNTKGFYEKFNMNRVSLQRGERAGLYSEAAPMSAEERQIFLDGVLDSYGRFKQVVANGRSIPYDELDPICEGRVWTGRQAFDHKLVDSYGDFVDAVRHAAELAKLPTDDPHTIPVMNMRSSRSGHILPKPFEAAEEISHLLSAKRLKELNGRALWLMPYHFKIR